MDNKYFYWIMIVAVGVASFFIAKSLCKCEGSEGSTTTVVPTTISNSYYIDSLYDIIEVYKTKLDIITRSSQRHKQDIEVVQQLRKYYDPDTLAASVNSMIKDSTK